MLLGTAVSGALVVVPLWAVSGMLSRRRARQFEEEVRRCISDVQRQVQERTVRVESRAAVGREAGVAATTLERVTHRFLALRDYLQCRKLSRGASKPWLLRLLWRPFEFLCSWRARRQRRALERARHQLCESLDCAKELWQRIRRT